MTLFAKGEDSVKDVFVRAGGLLVPVKKGFIRQSAVATQFYTNEIVITLSAPVNNLNLQSLFSAGDWSSDKKKRVVIDPGVVIGATSTANAALRTGTGRGGLLTIDNAGDIRGYGGAANGGAGGHAVNVEQSNLIINNSGFIRGGGGGGGKGGTGGTGGQGYYQTYYQEGPSYDGNAWRWIYYVELGYTSFVWAGSQFNNIQGEIGSYQSGSVIYYRGALQSSQSNQRVYAIYRHVYYNVYTNGGAGGVGGNGGLGIGHGQSQTAGAAGAGGGAPGTNAGWGGTGGTGGSGGTWGTAGGPGATGNTGAGGNYTGGSAGAGGSPGGAAGSAITGLARTLNNSGTIQGAV